MRYLGQILCMVAMMLSAGSNGLVAAESSAAAGSGKIPTTEIEFELLSEGSLESGLSAQEWGRVFQELGVSSRIRRPILQDRPEVREQAFGTIRRVTVIGRLEPSGRIVFSDRSFRLSETPRLAEWIRELRTYGAQGSPVGKPAFGLTPRQFGAVYTALTVPLETDVRGRAFGEAIALVPLPAEIPLRLSEAAKTWPRIAHGNHVVPQSLQGFSTGTALAVVLSEYGLGFRPLRTPSGSVELVVEPLEADQDRWPVGWEPPAETSRMALAPKLFKLKSMELNDVPLGEVLDTAAVATDVPILIDNDRVRALGIDVGKIRVSFPARQASWSTVLGAVTNPEKLARRLLVDEAGRPFVWITTLQSALQERKSEPPTSRVKP